MFQNKKIKLLEKQLNDEKHKNKKLQERLESKLKPGECKSGFCLICENFMGFVEDRAVCRLYDKAPCTSFKFNGFPCTRGLGNYSTELESEYLLNLPKQANH